MRLTIYTDYVLRMLTQLAISPEARFTIDDVAQAYDISRNHLMKVAHQLGKAGYIETVRGKGGGLRLAKPAASISIGEIVRLTEPDFALVPCFDRDAPACRIAPSCALIGILAEARAAFLAVLDRHSIADLMGPRGSLSVLLGVSLPAAA